MDTILGGLSKKEASPFETPFGPFDRLRAGLLRESAFIARGFRDNLIGFTISCIDSQAVVP